MESDEIDESEAHSKKPPEPVRTKHMLTLGTVLNA